MKASKSAQTMKPATAAKKLGVYLEATPEEFRAAPISRDQLAQWRDNPPAWLQTLRADGPHPRPVVAAKLGVSIAGLARGGVTQALTTAEIEALLAEQPEWLRRERESLIEVRREEKRVREQRAAARAESNREPRTARPPHQPTD
ncbi:hypothetical protein FOS14_16935 [Skermania sp. ID1734]|uniref:DUF5997 family protein n=1 Tax=Skermania sp. ID1734 TaxID=2597516 RepID=UPI00117E2075|nr:DUF5997 family protein [Skermania sp. ID1734]TSD96048.1 hypothetical protein FOS14_16935 [Skermania sp. ID1734]